MSCGGLSMHGDSTTPSSDKNVQTPAAQATGTANPAIPADHAPQTPEFLSKLLAEIKTLRQEQSELYAKMYPPYNPKRTGPPTQPAYEVMEEYRRQDREYDRKIYALKAQVDELRVLLARTAPPEPEINEV